MTGRMLGILTVGTILIQTGGAPRAQTKAPSHSVTKEQYER